MPDFEIEGNPGNIRSKANTLEQKGQLFYDTGDALSKIDVSGWTGRAADEFREAHDLEPDRWITSGNGFKRAAAGLTTYAGALESAQSRAEWVQVWPKASSKSSSAQIADTESQIKALSNRERRQSSMPSQLSPINFAGPHLPPLKQRSPL